MRTGAGAHPGTDGKGQRKSGRRRPQKSLHVARVNRFEVRLLDGARLCHDVQPDLLEVLADDGFGQS